MPSGFESVMSRSQFQLIEKMPPTAIDWGVEDEINLFVAMRGHKPVGINKHVQMLFICEKLNRISDRRVTIQQIWDHLGEMYDLSSLDGFEIVPFPNDEKDFSLPDEEFGELMEKVAEETARSPSVDETSKESGSEAQSKSSKGSKSRSSSSKAPASVEASETPPRKRTRSSMNDSRSETSGSAKRRR